MASRYDTWAPTAPIQLPIDAYRSAGLAAEEDSKNALMAVAQTVDAYKSIQPYGADAKAYYDQTMQKLNDNVNSIAKMDLSTPDAKRKIRQVLSDPAITKPLTDIMSDSLLAKKKQDELYEYKKKNPLVNTVEYQRAFNNINRESGDATKFDPNRFNKLQPLSEYTNVEKMIEEGIAKLGHDETALRRILPGDLYRDYKTKGLNKDKIRAYVIGNLKTNELVKEQIAHNVEYEGYKADPFNREDGIKKLAAGHRQGYNELYGGNIAEIQSKLEGKSMKQIEKDPKLNAMYAEMQHSQKLMDQYNKMDDESLVKNTYANNFIAGFDPFASASVTDQISYNPMASAHYNGALTLRMFHEKQAALKKAMTPELQSLPTTNPLPLTQTQKTDDKVSNKIGQVKGLEGVAVMIDNNGAFGGNDKLSKEIEKVGNILGKVSIKVKSTSVMKEQAMQKIKDYMYKNGISMGDYNNLKEDKDVTNVLKDIANFQSSTERTLLSTYTINQAMAPQFKSIALNSLSTGGLLDENGEEVHDKDLISNAAAGIKDPAKGITVTPALRNRNESFLTFVGTDDKVYHTPVPPEWQASLNASKNTIKGVIDNKNEPMINSDGSLNIIDMRSGGDRNAVNIPYAGTVKYQKRANQYFDHNLNNLVALGYSEKDATVMLNANYYKILDDMRANPGQPFPMKTPKGTIIINVPVKKKGSVAYTESDIMGIGKSAQPLDEFIRGQVDEFSSPVKNRYMFNASQGILSQKKRDEAILNFATEDFNPFMIPAPALPPDQQDQPQQ